MLKLFKAVSVRPWWASAGCETMGIVVVAKMLLEHSQPESLAKSHARINVEVAVSAFHISQYSILVREECCSWFWSPMEGLR
jgi:hypothetical protein